MPPSSSTATTAASSSRDATQQHAWESTDAASLWSSAVQEDADGNLISTTSALDEAALIRLRRHRLSRADYARSSKRLVRDMIRYVYLAIDLSHDMYERDVGVLPGGTRFDAVLGVVGTFIGEFFDQNPLSHLGLVVVRNGEAEMITRLTGSRTAHAASLVQLRRDVGRSVANNPNGAGGVFSLQNGLEVAGRSLGHMPRYGSREVVVIMGSLSTCDPGDVLVETLPRLKSAGIRVSCIALSAEVYVCRKISDETGGMLGVCLDKAHLRDLVLGQCVPPPARAGEEGEDGKKRKRECEFVQMGFPARRTDEVPSLVHSGRDRAILARTAYMCPRCHAKTAELPADCAVCGLKLILAPHLARSFHHLFPVPPFVEVAEETEVATQEEADSATGGDDPKSSTSAAPDIIGSAPPSCVIPDADVTSSAAPALEVGSSNAGTARTVKIDSKLLVSSKEFDRCCFACLKIIGVHEAAAPSPSANDAGGSRKVVGSTSSAAIRGGGSYRPSVDPTAPRPEPLRFQCPDCKNVFCADCDAYLHETLHNCPGCLCSTMG